MWRGRSSRERFQAFTSVITARSKPLFEVLASP